MGYGGAYPTWCWVRVTSVLDRPDVRAGAARDSPGPSWTALRDSQNDESNNSSRDSAGQRGRGSPGAVQPDQLDRGGAALGADLDAQRWSRRRGVNEQLAHDRVVLGVGAQPAGGRHVARRPAGRRCGAVAVCSSTTSKPTIDDSTSGVACSQVVQPSQPRKTRASDRAGGQQRPAPPGRRGAVPVAGGSPARSPPDARTYDGPMPHDPHSGPRAGLRLMHVHAHPDDESSKGAASTARYVAEGVDVHVATCTGGERGSILNPKMDRPDILENISEIRRQEMERARDILGVRQDWLGFVDSGLARGRPEAAAARGLLRAGAARGGRRAAGAADPRVPPARRHDVRRARRLPAPRPRQVPRDQRRGVRGGRRPGALPRRWASRGSR